MNLTKVEFGEFLIVDLFNAVAPWVRQHCGGKAAKDYGRFKRLRAGEFGCPPDMCEEHRQTWDALMSLPADYGWTLVVGELFYALDDLCDYSQYRLDGCRMIADLIAQDSEPTVAKVEGDFERIGKAAIAALWLWGLQPHSWELPGGVSRLYRIDGQETLRKVPGCADLLPDPYKVLVEALERKFTPEQRADLFDVHRGYKPIRNHRELFRSVGRIVVDVWELADPSVAHKAAPERPKEITAQTYRRKASVA